METLDILTHLDPKLPHYSNLRTKTISIFNGKSKHKDIEIANNLIQLYFAYIRNIDSLSTLACKEWLHSILPYFEEYYHKIRTPYYKILFSHQSDFSSSIFPELLYILYKKFVVSQYEGLSVETQKDITIDVSFLPYKDHEIYCKKKRVDVAILKQCPLVVNGKIIDFYIPLVAVEVKTNLDKNMISGVEYSVQRLKRTFPESKYFLISEFADFDIKKQNYAGSNIDEILIARMQKRSEIRNLKNEIKGINIDLLSEHIEEINLFLRGKIHQPLKLKDRMTSGKLIK